MEVFCEPVDMAPTKMMGPEESCAKMWVSKLPDGRQTSRIEIKKGFSWREHIKPILPNQPDWCPATHFGYLAKGCMEIEMENGDKKTVKAGEQYFVPPGHIPNFTEDTVMIEFTQDTTFTNKEFIEKKPEA